MSYRYVGSELELFATAANWKSYLGTILARFIAGRVLEVGAGIGANIAYLRNPRVAGWTSIEPDPELAHRISQRVRSGELPPTCHVVSGTIGDIGWSERFDTILYLDVLEHIAEDRAELAAARAHLAAEGNLVVLAPAHPFLFSRFDAAVGHCRRYGRASLCALNPVGCQLEAFLMLDCAGFFASLANRMLLRTALPSSRQVEAWDKLMVPISRRLDPLTGYRFGKTALAVWRAQA